MIVETYMKMYERAVSAGKPDKAKTLAAWHERAITTKAALLTVKEQYEKDLKELRETYSPKAFEDRRQKLDNEYNGILEIAKKKVTDDLTATLEGKKARFDECNGAPTDADLRLLTLLSMRDSLTAEEIATVSGKFGGNVQALRALGDIAKKHNVYFPDIGNPEAFERQITWASQFGCEMIDSIGTPTDELPYRQRLFWEAPGGGEAAHFFQALDGQGFTAEQVTAVTKEEKQDSGEIDRDGPSEIWAEVTARGGESLLAIAEQFHVNSEEIKRVNPGKDLNHLYTGDRFYVPSTKFSFHPGGTSVQPDQVRPVPKPVFVEPHGPNGESIGDDIDITL